MNASWFDKSAKALALPGFLTLFIGCGANNQYECIERTQKDVPNFQASGTHIEVDYVLLHDGHKFYAACDVENIRNLDPSARCGLLTLLSIMQKRIFLDPGRTVSLVFGACAEAEGGRRGQSRRSDAHRRSISD
jgi:hypothetical protein